MPPATAGFCRPMEGMFGSCGAEGMSTKGLLMSPQNWAAFSVNKWLKLWSKTPKRSELLPAVAISWAIFAFSASSSIDVAMCPYRPESVISSPWVNPACFA